MGYIAVFLAGMFLGAMCVIVWALAAAQKRHDDE